MNARGPFPDLTGLTRTERLSAVNSWRASGPPRPVTSSDYTFQNDNESILNQPTQFANQLPSNNIPKAGNTGGMELAAAAVGAGGNVISSLVSGGFQYGSALQAARASENNTKLITKTSYDIANMQNTIQEGQLKLQNSQLGLQREAWQRDWDSARNVGLANPSQFGSLGSSNFAFSRGTGSSLNGALRTTGKSVYGMNY